MTKQPSPVLPDLGATRPTLVLRRENRPLLIGGLVVWMLAWVGAAVSTAVFYEQAGTLAVCLGLLLVPALAGLGLLYLGINRKQTPADPQAALGEHGGAQAAWLAASAEGDMGWIGAAEGLDQYWQAQKVQAKLASHKQRRRLRIWGLVLLAVAVEALVLSWVILRETAFEVRMMFIPLAGLPAMVGLLLLARAWGIRWRDEKNLDAVRMFVDGS